MNKRFTIILTLLFGVTSLAINAKDLYLVGSATTAGWDPASAIKMTYNSERNEYVWEGTLQYGCFKVLEQTDAWWPGYTAPSNNQFIEDGETYYQLNYNDSEKDYKFVSYSGTYNIKVYFDDETPMMAIVATKDPIIIDKNSLQIVGDATPNGWTPTDMTKVAGEQAIFSYSGTLNEGNFKFRWSKDWWPALLTFENNKPIDQLDQTGLFYAPSEVDGMDYKFSVSKETAGNWEVLVNLDNLTITATKTTDTKDQKIDKVRIYTTLESIIIDSDEDSQYTIYNVSGIVVSRGELNTGTTVINIPDGIYIVSVGSQRITIKK